LANHFNCLISFTAFNCKKINSYSILVAHYWAICY
jgi:hypothetical protein